MRKLILLAVIGLCACGRKEGLPDQRDVEDRSLATVVHAADPRASREFASGFYNPDGGVRWTRSKFAVLLRTPAASERERVHLALKFFIPEVQIKRLGSVSVSAVVNGTPLPAETYTQAESHLYTRQVPAGALRSEETKVEFALDKWLAAGSVEPRELGLAVLWVGLAPAGSTLLF